MRSFKRRKQDSNDEKTVTNRWRLHVRSCLKDVFAYAEHQKNGTYKIEYKKRMISKSYVNVLLLVDT